jgi:hypothetical protein
MALQTPSAPARLHFSQVPPQRDPQQTPSVQKPLPHSPSAPQAWPAALTRRQVPPLQVDPAAQSPFDAQLVRQAPEAALQPYGAQSVAPASTQAPPPLQVSAAAATVGDRQLAGAQTVPFE